MVEILSYGVEEEFEEEKLIASMVNAGASRAVAEKIAKSIDIRDGMTTDEIRELVIKELIKVDEKAAKEYVKFKKKKEARYKDRQNAAYLISA